jgi:hypothetical protein
MAVFQLIYTSQPFGFDDAMLNGILVASRRNNPKSGITGCLICRHDVYLQLLEGDEAQVETLFDRIAVDDRHLAVTRLSGEMVDARMFPDWAMRDDPVQSWIWTPEEVHAGALTAASQVQLRAIFRSIAG